MTDVLNAAPALPGSPPVAAPPEAERRRVARLFARAGFGAGVDEIDRAAAKGYAATVDELLAFPPAATRPDELTALSLETGAPATESEAFSMSPYQRWWLDRMAATRWPLEEKLTLYWHNHFATGFSKVRRPKAMLAQNRLLRDHAGGNFRELCKAITADAAMLIWLDGNTNQKIKPNENYGREFMELFTLGRDRYIQEDVRQAARAFTGWTTDGQGNAVYHKELHDDGDKTILGNTGKWAGDDVADIVLDHHPEGAVAATSTPSRGCPGRPTRCGGRSWRPTPASTPAGRPTASSRAWAPRARPCCSAPSSATGRAAPSSRRPSTWPGPCGSST